MGGGGVNILPSLGQTSGLTTFPSFGERWVSSGTEVDGAAVPILIGSNRSPPLPVCRQEVVPAAIFRPPSRTRPPPAPQILLRDLIYKRKRGLMDASKHRFSCEFGRKARVIKCSPPALPVIVFPDFLRGGGVCSNPRSCRRIQLVFTAYLTALFRAILGYPSDATLE